VATCAAEGPGVERCSAALAEGRDERRNGLNARIAQPASPAMTTDAARRIHQVEQLGAPGRWRGFDMIEHDPQRRYDASL